MKPFSYETSSSLTEKQGLLKLWGLVSEVHFP